MSKLPISKAREQDLRNFLGMVCDYSGTKEPCKVVVNGGDSTITVEFLPRPGDVAILIGSKGTSIQAVRTILRNWGRNWGVRILVEVIEPTRKSGQTTAPRQAAV